MVEILEYGNCRICRKTIKYLISHVEKSKYAESGVGEIEVGKVFEKFVSFREKLFESVRIDNFIFRTGFFSFVNANIEILECIVIYFLIDFVRTEKTTTRRSINFLPNIFSQILASFT